MHAAVRGRRVTKKKKLSTTAARRHGAHRRAAWQGYHHARQAGLPCVGPCGAKPALPRETIVVVMVVGLAPVAAMVVNAAEHVGVDAVVDHLVVARVANLRARGVVNGVSAAPWRTGVYNHFDHDHIAAVTIMPMMLKMIPVAA